ncbi:nuclear transport factor 2 family protein [Glaciimonas soli]|uniref:Steroid delta-isomerase n=1 Tax=Glaciimonas soli TaxID=2590999 RepID=A0A843YQZ0_9BURK|nr:nuclear transport factor 2 family protein [Glaciimonas soli]MQR02179.1 steroid delta-isomerase [Glaciimonas soli]
MLTPLEVVERQFEAYNARDLDRFVSNFSETYRAYRMPSLEPYIAGKAQLTEFYATKRFNDSGLKLRAELIQRTVMGDKVCDHELLWGLTASSIEMMIIWEVRNGLIETSWAFSAA